MMFRPLTAGVFALAALGAIVAVATPLAARSATAPIDWAALDLVDIRGEPLAADTLAGKVVLVVNTASRCAFTPQYDALEALWDRYRGRGLVVLGVPSNDFGNQEPGSNAEIAAFCEGTYGVSFPMTAKARVTGPDAHPLFVWAREAGGRAAVPGWNFHKLLVARDGTLRATFPSFETPDSARVVSALEQALAEAPSI